MDALTVEFLSEQYLNLCDKNCAGEEEAGIFPCQFWKPPDVDEKGKPVASGCALVDYLAKVQQWGKK